MHESSNNMATTGVLYSQMFKILVIYFLCCLVSCDDGTPYTLEPVELPTDGDFKTFTHQEIKKYDGSDVRVGSSASISLSCLFTFSFSSFF